MYPLRNESPKNSGSSHAIFHCFSFQLPNSFWDKSNTHKELSSQKKITVTLYFLNARQMCIHIDCLNIHLLTLISLCWSWSRGLSLRAAERPPAAAEIEFSGIETVDSEEAGTTLTWCIHGCVREIMRARFKIRENDKRYRSREQRRK